MLPDTSVCQLWSSIRTYCRAVQFCLERKLETFERDSEPRNLLKHSVGPAQHANRDKQVLLVVQADRKGMARDAPTRERKAGSSAGNELAGRGQKGSSMSPTICCVDACCFGLRPQNCSWASKVASPMRVLSESAHHSGNTIRQAGDESRCRWIAAEARMMAGKVERQALLRDKPASRVTEDNTTLGLLQHVLSRLQQVDQSVAEAPGLP